MFSVSLEDISLMSPSDLVITVSHCDFSEVDMDVVHQPSTWFLHDFLLYIFQR